MYVQLVIRDIHLYWISVLSGCLVGIVADDEFVAYIDGSVVTSSVNFATQQLVNVTAYDSAQVSVGGVAYPLSFFPCGCGYRQREKISSPGNLICMHCFHL